MTTNIGKFRAQINTLIEFVSNVAPGDRELEKNKMKLETAMKINPRETVEFFVDTLEPYADHILLGNEEYFTQTSDETFQIDSEYSQFSATLRRLWSNLDKEETEFIKKRFKLLLMLGTVAVKHEKLRNIINKYRDPSNPLIF